MKFISFCLLLITLNFSNSIFAVNGENSTKGLVVAPLLGNYYIPGDFASINAAAIALNTNGISGPVIFNVAANYTETAPVGTSALLTGGISFGIISGTSATSTITFQKNGVGSNPKVFAGNNQFAGSIMNPVIKIIGADYLVFDGIDVSENPLNTNSTIATNNMTEFGYAFFYANTVATADGSQNNSIKNCTITLNTGGTNYQNTFGIYATTLTSSVNGTTAASITAISGSNSYNKLYGNFIINANFGIIINGSNTPAAMDVGWDIGGNLNTTGNIISNFGIGNGVTTSAYQKLGTTVQGILVNQIIDYNVSNNSLTSSTSNSINTMVGILNGWSGAIVLPTSSIFTCLNNTININNELSSKINGIWLRIGNTTNNLNLNTITISSPIGVPSAATLVGINANAGLVNNFNGNTITISPNQVPATSSIIGINSTLGTPNITSSTITISPIVTPITTTTLTITGINNGVSNGLISSNLSTINPQSTDNLIVVNFTSNGILNTGASNIFSNNQILIGSNTASGATNSNGISNSGDTCTIQNQTINIAPNATTASTVQGITNSGAGTSINDNNFVSVSMTIIANGTAYGITNTGSSVTILNNLNLSTTCTSTTGTVRVYGINNTVLLTTIEGNSGLNCTAVANLSSTITRGISTTVISSIKNNLNIVATSNANTTSTMQGIFGFGEISGNSLNVGSIAKTGITTTSGIQSNINTTVNNNTVTTNFYTDEGNVTAYGINSSNSNSIISNNTINHTAINNGNQVTLAWNAKIAGIYSFGTDTTLNNNTITGVYSSMGKGTTFYETAGIMIDRAANAIISNNIISNASTNGSADNRTILCGIYLLLNSYNAVIKNNRIYNISLNNDVTGVHPGPGPETGSPIPSFSVGIWAKLAFNTVLNDYKIYNNHISKIYNPSASSYGGIYGLLLSSKEINYIIYHNTISIGDVNTMVTSNITGNFGASAVGYLNRVGTGLTDLRNNILYVNAMPIGSGFVAALSAVKCHDLDFVSVFTNPGQAGIRPPNYNTSSNNNIFYAPSVHGRSSYFYCEGDGFGSEYNRFNIDHNIVAINDPNININPFSGCTSQYKTLMNGGSNNFGTDSNSYYENIALHEGTGTNVGYLTPVGETYAEMGAQVLGGQYDLDSVTISRGSSPDTGAIQFSGTSPTPPNISYAPIVINCGAIVSSATLDNVHIVDSFGIPLTGTLIPRIYYKVNSGSYNSIAGTFISGTTTDSYWSFTLTGLAVGTISYYVIAQDNLTKIISNPNIGLVACNVNNITTHPTSPTVLTIGGGSFTTYQLGTWSNSPLITSVVVFDDNYNSTVNIEACSVLVKAGRTVVFNATNTLLIQNELVVEPGGTLQFENNSSLVQISNTAVNSGNIVYKREASLRNLDYSYWSSPVSISTSPYVGQNVATISPTQTPSRIDTWIPDIPNSNLCEGDWIAYSGEMELGKGYALRAPSTFLPSTFSTFFGSFNGIANNGIINTPITRGNYQGAIYSIPNGSQVSNASDNYNLLGNPYPSAISASQFLFDNRTKLEGNVSIWTHGNLPIYTQSPFYADFPLNYTDTDYFTYTFTGTNCCPAAPADLFIGAGQGFFVEMKDGLAVTEAIQFNNGMRNVLHDNSIFYRNSQDANPLINIERNRIWLDVNGPLNNSDRTLVGYIAGASNNYDSFFDYKALLTTNVSIYTISNNENYLIQGKSLPFNIDDRIPIGIFAPETGNYNIAIGGLDGLFSTQNIYIEDKLLHIIHDLKIGPYSFEISNSGNYNERFDILFINNSLNLPTFNNNNNVVLWKFNDKINIKSTNISIEAIKIFDIGGRLLYCKDNINKNAIEISEIKENNEFLLVEITTTDKIKINKKIIF